MGLELSPYSQQLIMQGKPFHAIEEEARARQSTYVMNGMSEQAAKTRVELQYGKGMLRENYVPEQAYSDYVAAVKAQPKTPEEAERFRAAALEAAAKKFGIVDEIEERKKESTWAETFARYGAALLTHDTQALLSKDAKPNYTPGKEIKLDNKWAFIQKGWHDSIPGTIARWANNHGAHTFVNVRDPELSEKVLESVTGLLSDAPVYAGFALAAAPAAAGAATTAPAWAPAAIVAGSSMGFTDMMRTAVQQVDRGMTGESAKQLGRMYMQQLLSFGEGAMTGATLAVGGAAGRTAARPMVEAMAKHSPTASKLAMGAAGTSGEILGMMQAQAALHGQIPTMDEYVVAAASLGLLKSFGVVKNNLQDIWYKTGIRPTAIAQMTKSKHLIQELDGLRGLLAQDVLAGHTPVFRVLRNKDKKKIQEGEHNHEALRQQVYTLREKADALAEMNNRGLAADDPNFMSVEVLGVDNKYMAGQPGVTGFIDFGASPGARGKALLEAWFRYEEKRMPKEDRESFRKMTLEKLEWHEYNGTDGQFVQRFYDSPSQHFLDFLANGKAAEVKGTEIVPLGRVQGYKIGESVVIADQGVAQPWDSIHKGKKVLHNWTAEEIFDSANNIAEHTLPAKKRKVFTIESFIDSMTHNLVDKTKILNKGAKRGEVTIPYLMARLNAGIYGRIQNMVDLGMAKYKDINRLLAGEHIEHTGESLIEIIKDASQINISEVLPGGKKYGDSALNRVVERGQEAHIAELLEMKEDLKVGHKKAREQYKNKELTKKEFDKLNEHFKIAQGAVEEQIRAANTTDNVKPFIAYVQSVEALKRASKGDKALSGVNNTHIEEWRQIANDPYFKKRYEPVRKRLNKLAFQLLEYKRDAGLISQDAYIAALKARRANDSWLTIDSAFDARTGAFKATSVVEHLVRDIEMTVREAEFNSIKREMAKLHDPHVGSQVLETEGPLARLEAQRIAVDVALSEYANITFKENGKTIHAKVPRLAKETFDNFLDPKVSRDTGVIIKALSKYASFRRAGIILAPDFIQRNVFRDQLEAWVFTQNKAVLIGDFVKGLYAILFNGKAKQVDRVYEQFQTHGGANATYVGMDQARMEKIYTEAAKATKPRNVLPLTTNALNQLKRITSIHRAPIAVVKGMAQSLRNLSELSENATRVGAYQRALEAGYTHVEAALQAREVTLDFGRSGAVINSLNAMSMFLNANIQGASKLVRAVTDRPVNTVYRMMLGVGLPAFYCTMIEQDYLLHSPESDMAEVYKEMTDMERNSYFHLPINGTMFRLPVPEPFRALVRSVREATMYATGLEPEKTLFDRLGEARIGHQILDSLMIPTDAQKLTGLGLLGTPAAVSLGMELYTDTDFYMGKRITPASVERIISPWQESSYSTELSKELSKWLMRLTDSVDQVSPVHMDYFADRVAGSIGKVVWRGLDKAAQQAGLIKAKQDIYSGEWQRWPFVQAFVCQYPKLGTHSLTTFFNNEDRIAKLGSTFSHLLKKGNIEDLRDLMEKFPEGHLARSYSAYKKTIMTLITNVKTLQDSDNIKMPLEERRAYADKHMRAAINAARQANRIFDQVIKQLYKENEKSKTEAHMLNFGF